ncbi:MAG: NAD(P)/FAD-dependent oxidoreductase [Dehalococcoidia bacterium]|nr:NAD(P)/FAD-dependent oxidoreductase [Dehalococcoidia bacterium]
MSDHEYNVIVIGAGPGGVACAAALAGKGIKILLVEKNDRPGGKSMSFSKNGFTYELWPISGSPTRDNRFSQFTRELGLDLQMIPPPGISGVLYKDNQTGEYKPFTKETGNPTEEQVKEVKRFLGDIRAMQPDEIDKLDDVTFHDFISNYRVPVPFYSQQAMDANITFVEPIDMLAASEVVRTRQDFMRSGAGLYFKGGYGKMAEALAGSVKANGGDVLTNARVEKIEIKDGKVTGVVTAKGTFKAPIVVSNAGIQPTVLKLVGPENFDKDYVEYVRKLQPSVGLMGIRYFLDRPVFDLCTYITYSDDNYINKQRLADLEKGKAPDDLLVFMVVPSVFDPDLAPVGKQCVLASTLCPADAKYPYNDMLWKKLDATINKIWPLVAKHTESKDFYSTGDVSSVSRDHVLPGQGGECIGLGQIVGQCGKHKPSAAAPVKGLFYAGCDAGGYGCGTHHGVDSGIRVSELVLQYKRSL